MTKEKINKCLRRKNDKITLTIKNSSIDYIENRVNKHLINAGNFEKIKLEDVYTNTSGETLIYKWENCGEIIINGGNLLEKYKNKDKQSDVQFALLSGQEI